MKCAIELLAMNTEALNDKALAHERAVARSIQYCEDVIAPFIEKFAKAGKLPMDTPHGRYSWEETLTFKLSGAGEDGDISPLYFDGATYANGEKSYDWKNVWYDRQAIIDYCAKFCIEVSFKTHWFKHYGCGEQEGVRMLFKVNPSCLG